MSTPGVEQADTRTVEDATLLVAMASESDRRQVGEWLSGRYAVQPLRPERLAHAEGDVLLVGGSTLQKHRQVVADRKQKEQPVLLPVLLLTSADNLSLARHRLAETVDDLVTKPVRRAELEARVEVLLRTRRMSLELERRRAQARSELEQATAELSGALEEVESSHTGLLKALAGALDLRNVETQEHCRRVAGIARRLAEAAGLEGEELDRIWRGGLLHDIGKIGIPDAILLKPSSLSQAERALVEEHPEYGEELLSDIPFLEKEARIVRFHHERWDGEGYPDRLAGEDIPLGARIFALADTYDAMTSDRPYRSALPTETAAQEIRDEAGSQFDPNLVEVFDWLWKKEMDIAG